MIRTLTRRLFPALLLLTAPSVFATDGQILINESTVSTAGGYPYRITQPGSYKLSGNLTATPNTPAILLTSSNVSIDLNGFTINCSAQAPAPAASDIPCISDNSQPLSNLFVRNGSLALTSTLPFTIGQQFTGVSLSFSHGITVENLHIDGKSTGLQINAIKLGTLSIIRHNTFTGVAGPQWNCPSLLEGNVNGSGSAGSSGDGCVYVSNVGLF